MAAATVVGVTRTVVVGATVVGASVVGGSVVVGRLVVVVGRTVVVVGRTVVVVTRTVVCGVVACVADELPPLADATVVSVMGDGSFGFTAGEMETVVRLKLPITFVVVSNAVFGWIKAGQKYGFGERYFSVDFDRTDHARVAEAFGVKAWRVEDPNELQATLKRAVETDGPTLEIGRAHV